MSRGEWFRHSHQRPRLGLRCSRQHARFLPGSETVRIRPIPLSRLWSPRGDDAAPSGPSVCRFVRATCRTIRVSPHSPTVWGDRDHFGGEWPPPSPAEPANQRVGKPGTPRASGARNRRFKSGHADCFVCEVLCWYRQVTVNHLVRGFDSLSRSFCGTLLSDLFGGHLHAIRPGGRSRIFDGGPLDRGSRLLPACWPPSVSRRPMRCGVVPVGRNTSL